MKIKELSFKNKANPWELEKTEFSDLTLLVGASGVGKTRILNSIMELVKISNGSVYNGVEWDFSFTGNNDENYQWIGEFESRKEMRRHEFAEKDLNGSGTSKQIPRLLMEKLYVEDRLVFEREESTVKYEKKETPKISPYKSVLNIFTTESGILTVKEELYKIISLDYRHEQRTEITKNFWNEAQIFMGMVELSEIDQSSWYNDQLLFKNKSKEDKLALRYIMERTDGLIAKLFLISEFFKDIFNEIAEDFKDVFPQVREIRFELLKEKEIYELQVKERGTGWIAMSDISEGMFKTLLHLTAIKLMSSGFVILIDEFENSLGVNCIDVVADGLVSPYRNSQYIITSHHPYVINNIDMKYWKIVVRKGTTVSTRTYEQLKLGKSKHEAFKQLLNTDEFAEGIT
ncbi:MAG: ATP-binding protein [Candidatus Aminicenantes bacterium]|nr:ATP-binding protein [Candidatus Aminicenantes bacterium]